MASIVISDSYGKATVNYTVTNNVDVDEMAGVDGPTVVTMVTVTSIVIQNLDSSSDSYAFEMYDSSVPSGTITKNIAYTSLGSVNGNSTKTFTVNKSFEVEQSTSTSFNATIRVNMYSIGNGGTFTITVPKCPTVSVTLDFNAPYDHIDNNTFWGSFSPSSQTSTVSWPRNHMLKDIYSGDNTLYYIMAESPSGFWVKTEGLSTSADGSAPIYNISNKFVPKSNTTLYPAWGRRTFTLKLNDGTGASETVSVPAVTTKVPSLTIARQNADEYRFLYYKAEVPQNCPSWPYDGLEGEDYFLADNASYVIEPYRNSSHYLVNNIVFHAQWKRKPTPSIIDTIRASEYESDVPYNPLGTGDYDDDLSDIAYDPLSDKYSGHLEAVAYNGATIASITAKVLGDQNATTLTLTSAEVDENDLTASDCKTASGYLLQGAGYSQDFTVVYRVTDSDGDYSEATVTVPKTPNYTSPTFSMLLCERCESNGTVSDDGTYLKLVLDVDTYVLPKVGNPAAPIASAVYDRRANFEFKMADDSIAFNESLNTSDAITSTTKRAAFTKVAGSTPWLFDENASYKAMVKVSDGVEESSTIVELIPSAFFTMDVLGDGYRGEYVVTQVTSLEEMSLDSNHEATHFYRYYNGRYVDVTTGGLVLPLAECDYEPYSDTKMIMGQRYDMGDLVSLNKELSHGCTITLSYNTFHEVPPGWLGTMDYDVYQSTFTYGVEGADGAFYYDGNRTFTLVSVPSRDYVMNVSVGYTYVEIDYENPGYVRWFMRTGDIDVDPDKTYYADNPYFTGHAWCDYRMVEVQSPVKSELMYYYEDVTETLDPTDMPWYEKDPNPTGPKPGHGISFGAPSKHEGFNVSMPEFHYEHEVLPVYKGDTAPTATDMLWIDTSAGKIMKYHNGTDWVCVGAVWG